MFSFKTSDAGSVGRSGGRRPSEQLASHGGGLLISIETGQGGTEEEGTQHSEEHEQLDEDGNNDAPAEDAVIPTEAIELIQYGLDIIANGNGYTSTFNTTIVNEAVGVSAVQYVDGKFWVNNHAHILQGVGDATTELLYLILLKTNIKEYVTGAVQAKLNQDNLRAIPAIRISKDDMASFNAIIQPIFAVIRNNNLEIDNLQVLKASILTKLTQAN